MNGVTIPSSKGPEALPQTGPQPAVPPDPLLAAISSAPLCMAVFDREMRYLAVSRRFLTAFGLDPEAPPIGRCHYDVSPGIPLHWRQAHRRVLVEGAELGPVEEPVEQADGAVDWVRWSAAPWRDAAGEIGGLVLTTELVTAEIGERAELGAAETRYRVIFNQAAVGVARVSPEGRFLEVNDRFCAITGYDREELLGFGFQQITDPADLEADIMQADALLAGEIDTYAIEKRYLAKDGGGIWVNLTASLVRTPDGAPDYFVFVVEDIGDRKAAAAAIEESRAREREQLEELEAIYETSPVGLAFLTPDLRFLRVNRRLAEMNGLPAADHIGRTVGEIVPAVADQVQAIVQRLNAGEAVVSWEVAGEMASSPGQQGAWLEYWRPLNSPTGGLRGFNVVVEDITERKRAEDRRRLLIDELNHRVKNTLAVVQSIARQTLAGDAASPAARAAFEDRLHALAAAHTVLTRENWESAGLDEIIDGAVGSHDRVLRQGPPVALKPGVAVSLSLALHELATNAAKYGALSRPEGRVQVRWTVEARDGPVLRLAWEESGGPPVQPPTRRGFGTRLLQRALSHELGGAVELEFRPEGVVCRIEARLQDPPPSLDRPGQTQAFP